MEKNKGKHPGGRPTKYKPEYCLTVEYMARAGMTDAQIAEKLGISEATITNWKKDYPEFLASLKAGKEDPDDLVERSLFERATGYQHEVEKPMVVSMGKDNGSEVEIVKFTESLAPDVTAQIFWLKNRRPDRWREKAEVEHSGTVQIIDDIPKAK